MTTAPAACDLLIRNAHVLTMDAAGTAYPSGAVAVTGRAIVAVGTDADLAAHYRPMRVIDAGGSLVHPGLVDTHYHATFHMVGKMIEERDTSKEDPGPWVAQQYTGLINAMGAEEEHANALLACLDMARNGVTAFLDPGTAFHTDAVAEAAQAIGVRASLADPWLWDLKGPQLSDITGATASLDRCMNVLGSELKRNADPDSLIRGHIAIFGMGSQSDRLALAAKAMAEKAGATFSMHQSQSVDDALFDEKRWGRKPLRHLQDIGLLGGNTILTHMNVLTPEEIALVGASRTSVVWSINAWYYGTRVQVKSPMPELHRAGANVTLALDVSKAASFGSNQIFVNYLLARDQGDYVSPEDLLRMHTINAARALKMDDRIGSLEAGKRADIVIRTNAVPEANPTHNLVRQHLIVAGSKSIDTVLVDGRVIVKGGRAVLVDEAAVYAIANRASQRMRQRADA